MDEKEIINDLVDTLRNLMMAAESNNDYDSDRNLQEAVADGEQSITKAERFLKVNK